MIFNHLFLFFRCPTKPCQKAKPFAGPPGTTITGPNPPSPPSGSATQPTYPTHPIDGPAFMQICVGSDIRPPFQSQLGTQYCQEVCIGKPMYLCNLYLCYCDTRNRKEQRFI